MAPRPHRPTPAQTPRAMARFIPPVPQVNTLTYKCAYGAEVGLTVSVSGQIDHTIALIPTLEYSVDDIALEGTVVDTVVDGALTEDELAHLFSVCDVLAQKGM